MNRPPRTAALLAACLLALAGCSSGSDDAGAPSSAPRSSAGPSSSSAGGTVSGGASTPAGSATPQRTDAGGARLGEVDFDNFTFAGGCGFEVPAMPIELHNGKQHKPTPEVDGLHSTARLAGRRQITLAGKPYVLAELRCTIGDDKVTAAHLIGAAGGRPTDLGIVATGSKVTVKSDQDQLQVRTRYRTIDDDAGTASGTSSYKISMVGNTPVRLFGDEDTGGLDDAVAQLPAHGYDAGLVGITGYLDDPSESYWWLGLLDQPDQVVTADSIGGGYDSGACWKTSVYTQAGEKIGTGRVAFADDDSATGTALDLDQQSSAATGRRGDVTLPVKNAIDGLLVPADGVVPALATVTTDTSEDQLKTPLVTTRAPADAWLDVWRFGPMSGSEFKLPVGAFATADGRIAMTGAWFNAPVQRSDAGYGMGPIVAPDAVGEKTCG